MGRLLYDAVLAADFNLAVVLVMLMAVFVVVANLIADVLYAYLDPRIQYA
jgi:peptide/nickel transport system permease protein